MAQGGTLPLQDVIAGAGIERGPLQVTHNDLIVMGGELGQGLMPIRRRLDRVAISVQQPCQASYKARLVINKSKLYRRGHPMILLWGAPPPGEPNALAAATLMADQDPCYGEEEHTIGGGERLLESYWQCWNRAIIVSRGGKAAVHFSVKSVHDWQGATSQVDQLIGSALLRHRLRYVFAMMIPPLS
jgi:hypothetical protein